MKAPHLIRQFYHCRRCIAEWQDGAAPGQSPSDYARLEVGPTLVGMQVRCKRHDLNIVHIDFEGCVHPADLGETGTFDREWFDPYLLAFNVGTAVRAAAEAAEREAETNRSRQ